MAKRKQRPAIIETGTDLTREHLERGRDEVEKLRDQVYASGPYQLACGRLLNATTLALRSAPFAGESLERAESLDDGAINAAVELAATLLRLAYFPRANSRDSDLLRELLATLYRNTPIVIALRGRSHRPVFTPKAEPWEIMLARLFQVYQPLRERLSAGRGHRGARAACTDLLQKLWLSGVTLPPAMRRIREASGTGTMTRLSAKDASRFESACTFLHSLVGAPLPAPYEGQFEFRVSIDRAGGRGEGRRLTPWSAAVAFADCFNVEMRSLKEARRLKTRR